jgi:vitamin B12 transporter
VFQNVITDRIIIKARAGVAHTSDFANNPSDIVVRGVEVQAELDLLKVLARPAGLWRWSLYGNGVCNF